MCARAGLDGPGLIRVSLKKSNNKRCLEEKKQEDEEEDDDDDGGLRRGHLSFVQQPVERSLL